MLEKATELVHWSSISVDDEWNSELRRSGFPIAWSPLSHSSYSARHERNSNDARSFGTIDNYPPGSTPLAITLQIFGETVVYAMQDQTYRL